MHIFLREMIALQRFPGQKSKVIDMKLDCIITESVENIIIIEF